jgi:hypothetical protein
MGPSSIVSLNVGIMLKGINNLDDLNPAYKVVKNNLNL